MIQVSAVDSLPAAVYIAWWPLDVDDLTVFIIQIRTCETGSMGCPEDATMSSNLMCHINNILYKHQHTIMGRLG